MVGQILYLHYINIMLDDRIKYWSIIVIRLQYYYNIAILSYWHCFSLTNYNSVSYNGSLGLNIFSKICYHL